MPVKINASTSSGLVVDSDLTGSLQLQTGGNPAISIDSSQVTNFAKQFQINGVLPPAFSVTRSSNQTLSSNTWTKYQGNVEEFDTASFYDASTNYRFTPNIAGYYQFTGRFGIAATDCRQICSFYKNGSEFKRGVDVSADGGTTASALIYLNGTTDYVEMYMLISSGQAIVGFETYFQGIMVRAA